MPILTLPCDSWSMLPPPGWGGVAPSGWGWGWGASPCFCLVRSIFIPVLPPLIYANIISHLCSLPSSLLAKQAFVDLLSILVSLQAESRSLARIVAAKILRDWENHVQVFSPQERVCNAIC